MANAEVRLWRRTVKFLRGNGRGVRLRTSRRDGRGGKVFLHHLGDDFVDAREVDCGYGGGWRQRRWRGVN